VGNCRLLIIGLDGATFDLIEPWVAAGDLPVLSDLMQRGAWGPLRSTIPATTFPAWSTMMTGVNPGRHGIFDFTRRPPGRYAVEFVNATHRRHPTLWNMLSQAGCRVGVVGLPATYPPEQVNGLMIAGFDSPVTTGVDASFVYPRQLWHEIRRVADYRITDFQELRIGPNWHADALERMQVALHDRLAIAEHLLAREEWDCFTVLFGESDTVSHHFWMYHDPASPRYDANAGQPLAGAIRTIYRQLDAAIGQLLAVTPEATVIILSDHGFGGTGNTVVYLNRWLQDQGYLHFQDSPGWIGSSLRLGKRLGLRLLPSVLQEQVFRRCGGRLANRLESGTRFCGVDWAGTRAFSEESNTCPAIWLNLAGREAAGIVAADAYHTLRDEIIARLQAWRHPTSGQPIVARAWRREELYAGPYVAEAPDIVLELALEEGYALTCQSSQGRPGPSVRQLTPSEYIGAKGQSMNGSHRSDGVLIMAGPGVRTGQHLIGASLMDVAPTALALLGETAAVALDGRILYEALYQRDEMPAGVQTTLNWAPGPIRAYALAEARNDCAASDTWSNPPCKERTGWRW
jgi:predicted AlkP superfamily phosphohydrolase/phosphomutase